MMIISIIIAAIALVVGLASTYYYGNDNPIEELAEEVIEAITGIEEIDLSPWEEEPEENTNDAL